MRQERAVQARIFDLSAEHEIGRELKAMSRWLDEHLCCPDRTPVCSRNDPRLSNLYFDVKLILDERSLLLASCTSVFADEGTRLMGTSLAEHFVIQNDAPYSGTFERAEAIDGSSSDRTATGVARREGAWQGLRRIVLVDRDGRVAGHGLGASSRRRQRDRPAVA